MCSKGVFWNAAGPRGTARGNLYGLPLTVSASSHGNSEASYFIDIIAANLENKEENNVQ